MTKRPMFVTLALLSASLTVVHPAPAQAAYPGENGRILFSGDGGFGTWDIHTMNPDGTDIVNLTPGLFTAEHGTWSPDGTQIAFSHTQGSPSGCGVGDIYVMNADGSDLTPITTSEFGTTAFDPTWSPDGSEIAFTRAQNDSACSGADLDIWKMNSDGSGQVLLTAGTNDFGPAADQEPTWSPDGDRIAFRSNRHTSDWSDGNQIWTMDPDGSNVTQVTHRPDGTLERNTSPAWSPDGEQIAYRHFLHRPPAGLGPTQIWLINEDGTGPTAVTTNGLGGNMNPAWSPNGQQIVFTAAFEEPPGTSNNDIFVIDVDGTDQTNITNTGVAKDRPDWQPLVAPPPPTVQNGRIIVSGEAGTGTSDLITMNPDGSDRVNLTPGGFDEELPEWSPDGTKIAFSRTTGSPSGCRGGDVYVMDADGSNVTPLTNNEFGVAAYDPTWSPDGTEIAFTREHYDSSCTSGDVDIWKMNSDGSGQVLLTSGGNAFGPALDDQPAWSPDGDRIAFRSDRATADWTDSNQIYTMDPDGSNVTQVTRLEFHTFEVNLAPTWSPDGEQIAFERHQISPDPPSTQATSQIYRINEDGTGEAAVTSNENLANMTPEWSPDGQRILFNTQFEDPPDKFNNDLFMINVDGTDQIRVTHTGTALGSMDWQPLLPPPPPPGANGRIAFVSSGPEGSFTEDIWTMNPDGSDRVNLLPGEVSEGYPEWSPDGTKIAFTRGHGSPSGASVSNIYVMNADGSNVTQLTHNELGIVAQEPSWSPDGQQMVFTRIDGSGFDIWKMNADGTGQTALTTRDTSTPFDNSSEAAWSPDGDRIAFVSDRPNDAGGAYSEIWTMDTDGSDRTKLTHTPVSIEPEQNLGPAWSPDGDQIAWEHWWMIDGNPEIWVMNEDGSNEHAVVSNGFVSNNQPAWSPDGQQLVFSALERFGEGENNEIFTINVDGSNQTQITDNAIIDWYPSWQPLVAPPPDPNVIVTDCNDPALATLTTVEGDLVIDNVPDCDAINLANLVEVGGNLVITNNMTDTISIGAGSVAGEVNISGNLVLGEISMGNGMAAGELTLHDNDAGVISIGGGQVSGEITITENDAGVIDIGDGAQSGVLTLEGNQSDTISMSGGAVSGEITLTENQGEVISIGGGQSSGELTITMNETEVIDISDAGAVSGNVTIEDNGDAEVVPMGDGSVSGNLDIESTGEGVFSMGSTEVSGELTLDLTGYDEVDGSTAGGAANLESTRAEATMHVQLPDGAFDAAVGFRITRLAPDGLAPEDGTGADDEDATIDPLAAYQFDFDVPTLNADATLTFDIHVDGLDAATRQALLEALDTGTATMATRGDAPDATYQAFPVCTGEQVPSADGCVLIETLDADGNPTTDTPVTVRFSNVVGHFSTWAVVTTETVADEPTEEPTTQPTQPPVSPPQPPPGDTTAPTITVPDDIVVNATTPAGRAVTFETVATDVDGTGAADCDPASGSVFPVGEDGLATAITTVTCTKTDAAGNEAAPATFTVTVRGAFGQLASLRNRLHESQVSQELWRHLSRKVRFTLRKLRATPPDLEGACSTLRAFVREIERNVGSEGLNRFAAGRWIRTARRVRTVIGC